MIQNRRTRVMVGMSGGVDSSVAALLLVEQGYDVCGMFMKNWEEDDRNGHCAAAADFADTQQVCDTIGIPLHTVNFSYEYWERVFQTFLAEHRAGRTPNPDIVCNKEIKFKEFHNRARDLGAEFVATGHYAQIERTDGELRLLKGADSSKDQSYFLYTLNQSILARTLFPIGHLAKTEVRELAKSANFANHSKKDSTGICFIGERNFRSFLQKYLPPAAGPIVSIYDDDLGEHDGLMYYTTGQRQGLGIGGPGEPWYVVDKDMDRNALIVAQGHNHPALFHGALEARDLHWVAGVPPAQRLRCTAMTRYRQNDQDCVAEYIDNDTVVVEFDEPQRALTAGQSVVFNRDAVCLGGGIINKPLAPCSDPSLD